MKSFPYSGILRKGFQAMYEVCTAAISLVDAIEAWHSRPQDAYWESIVSQRFEDLRRAVVYLREARP